MVGESIDYGEKEAEFVIIDLLIDDDNDSRCHRLNIF